jgi:hypothetical protein
MQLEDPFNLKPLTLYTEQMSTIIIIASLQTQASWLQVLYTDRPTRLREIAGVTAEG